ncbi:MAG: restriction endonuclease [Anaerolineaceae bacterium 4572_78]|nr:MAG: restriction endonuclease [Anaerolineaceae bacterium 4572_78]
MDVTSSVVQKVVRRLIHGQDYRVEVITVLDSQFLEYAVDFFKKVIEAKLQNQQVTMDWYKKELLDPNLPSNDIAIHAGLNKKTISNMYNSTRKEIIVDASEKHYNELYELINRIVEDGSELDITLTIKFRGVSVDLNMNESLIVINTLAVKRSAFRGGNYSKIGKRVEVPLMTALCKLFQVPSKHYTLQQKPKSRREVDFYLLGHDLEKKYRGEVKLMGKGNPESADAVIARDSDIFVADKLSDLNKEQLTDLGVEWVELRAVNGYRRFFTILQRLDIPCHDFTGMLNTELDTIFESS